MAISSTRIRAQLHAPASCHDDVASTLALAGLQPARTAGVALLVTDRDDPGAADQWSVDSLPHLVVRLAATSVRIGPFVHPGVTACLRCLEATGPGVEPAPTPYTDVDPALRTVAMGWAVRDLVSWQAGQLPTTWSSTVTIRADLQPEVTRWTRHPHCGCSWGLGLAVGARVG